MGKTMNARQAKWYGSGQEMAKVHADCCYIE
jgi:hypothetical protein